MSIPRTSLARPLMLSAALLMGTAAFAQAQEETASATFENLEGAEIGSASLSDTPEGVLIELQVSDLPSGQWVSFHIHEEGVCDPADEFESAGDHYNPDDSEHGYHVPDGPHAGDMPNQYVGEDGMLNANVFNAHVTLDGENPVRGLALIIHDGTDDYHSQPAGEAGDRIACAIIE